MTRPIPNPNIPSTPRTWTLTPEPKDCTRIVASDDPDQAFLYDPAGNPDFPWVSDSFGSRWTWGDIMGTFHAVTEMPKSDYELATEFFRSEPDVSLNTPEALKHARAIIAREFGPDTPGKSRK